MRKPIQQQQVVRERDHNADQRAATVYRLWLRGWTFARIAQEVGYSNEGAAWKAWKRAKMAQKAPPDLEDEKRRERERLEIAYAGIAERVEQGNDWAIDRAMSIAARKAALLGLDAKREDETPAHTVVREVYPAQWVDALSALNAPAPQPVQPPPIPDETGGDVE